MLSGAAMANAWPTAAGEDRSACRMWPMHRHSSPGAATMSRGHSTADSGGPSLQLTVYAYVQAAEGSSCGLQGVALHQASWASLSGEWAGLHRTAAAVAPAHSRPHQQPTAASSSSVYSRAEHQQASLSAPPICSWIAPKTPALPRGSSAHLLPFGGLLSPLPPPPVRVTLPSPPSPVPLSRSWLTPGSVPRTCCCRALCVTAPSQASTRGECWWSWTVNSRVRRRMWVQGGQQLCVREERRGRGATIACV